MNKNFIKLTLGLLSASVLSTAGNVLAQPAGITAEQAKAIALADAKVQEKDVVFIKNQRDVENGVQVYDIEFYVGNKEYDYEISVANGAIVHKDMDIENFVAPTPPQNTPKPQQPAPPKPQQPNTDATAVNAKQIALQHANLKEADVQRLTEKIDYENGRKVIDVKFYSDGKEYEYEIDAQTGAIREWDVDHDDDYYDWDDRDDYDDRYDYDDDDDRYDNDYGRHGYYGYYDYDDYDFDDRYDYDDDDYDDDYDDEDDDD
ncbi:PepSY domain-containing protein [Aerococcaceae bacterium NML191292]|nr:PepSY domain-containing protein [Aerococcaceae bacterium NML191292]MCW6667177.1 PepSY domain-containing protein [Aerococcaceae bacterium NML190938]MCW6675020.1 PepSY domain-containing protein [Aerococcaceae bacterium NML171108]